MRIFQDVIAPELQDEKQRLGFNTATLSVPRSKGILAGKQKLCNEFTTACHVEDLIERRLKAVYVCLRISPAHRHRPGKAGRLDEETLTNAGNPENLLNK